MKILFSQLIGLISASFEVKHIQLHDGDIVWRTAECPVGEDVHRGEHALSIKWGSSRGKQYLYMSLDHAETRHEDVNYIYKAYFYQGDNCNDRTRFLYKIIADDISIIDDLGITNHGGEIGKTYLTNLSAKQYQQAKTNNKNGILVYVQGRWESFPFL